MARDNDNLGGGWTWWIIFLTLCVMQSCDDSSNNKSKVQELEQKIQILETDLRNSR